MTDTISAQILVVDDEPDLELLIKQRFRKQIRDNIYFFRFAANGIEALELLELHKDIEIVLCDINMPVMDGLTFLSKLAERDDLPIVRTVIVSAYGDMENIRTAMNRGAFDFITKPIDFGDLETTIEKTLGQVRSIRQAKAANENLQLIRKELDVASRIQRAIVPDQDTISHSAVDTYARMKPAAELGGDFYDYFLLDKDHLAFAIGDVSGKGVPAALFMAVSRTILKATAFNGLKPAECISNVNTLLVDESIESMFVSLFYGVIDLSNRTLTYASAGHNPPYLISGGSVRELQRTGDMVAGVERAINYTELKCDLKPGDRLLCYTDGVTEAFNPKKEEYGQERLERFLFHRTQETIQSLARQIEDDIVAFTKDAHQNDDITILLLQLHEV